MTGYIVCTEGPTGENVANSLLKSMLFLFCFCFLYFCFVLFLFICLFVFCNETSTVL